MNNSEINPWYEMLDTKDGFSYPLTAVTMIPIFESSPRLSTKWFQNSLKPRKFTLPTSAETRIQIHSEYCVIHNVYKSNLAAGLSHCYSLYYFSDEVVPMRS